MADYRGFTLTNYFSVIDEERFRRLMAECAVNGEPIEIFERENETGKSIKFGFGCYGSIVGIKEHCENEEVFHNDDDEDYSHDTFCNELQKVIARDDAILITEVGYEKLRYLIGCSTIITRSSIETVSLKSKSLDVAREMLANPSFLFDC